MGKVGSMYSQAIVSASCEMHPLGCLSFWRERYSTGTVGVKSVGCILRLVHLQGVGTFAVAPCYWNLWGTLPFDAS